MSARTLRQSSKRTLPPWADAYIWVAKVRRGSRDRVTESTQVVELLARVVSVDVDPVAREHVHRVLDGPDAARGRVLGDADVVAQAPAQDPALVGVGVGAAARQGGQVEGLDHRAAAVDVLGAGVQVRVAAARDDELVGLLLGHGQRAADVVCVVHAADDGGGRSCDRAGARAVLPGEDGLGRGCVERGAVAGQRDAVSKLVMMSIAEDTRSKDLCVHHSWWREWSCWPR